MAVATYLVLSFVVTTLFVVFEIRKENSLTMA
jgi:hypothetical protein